MSLPNAYANRLADALVALRAGAPAFEATDLALVYGDPPPPGAALPKSTAKADCIAWLAARSLDELIAIAQHLPGLADQEPAAITAYANYSKVIAKNSLAALAQPLVASRELLVGAVEELRTGQRRMLRVWGDRRSGKTFTTEILEEWLGATAGGDQFFIKVDVSEFPDQTAVRTVKAVLERRNLPTALPEATDVTSVKYTEQLGDFLVRMLRDATKGEARTWVVFDRCGVAAERADLRSLLRAVAAAVKKYARDARCPRVIFIEANDELLATYSDALVREPLVPIEEHHIQKFFADRGCEEPLLAARVKVVLDALGKVPLEERLEELQGALADALAKAAP